MARCRPVPPKRGKSFLVLFFKKEHFPFPTRPLQGLAQKIIWILPYFITLA
jgi:hypothetical protein